LLTRHRDFLAVVVRAPFVHRTGFRLVVRMGRAVYYIAEVACRGHDREDDPGLFRVRMVVAGRQATRMEMVG